MCVSLVSSGGPLLPKLSGLVSYRSFFQPPFLILLPVTIRAAGGGAPGRLSYHHHHEVGQEMAASDARGREKVSQDCNPIA